MVSGLLMELDDHNCWTIAEEDHQLSKQVAGLDAGLIPVTVPELLRLLRDVVIPLPRRDRAHRLHGQPGDGATSTAPARPTCAGTPTPRQHHDHNELQLPYQSEQGPRLRDDALTWPDSCGIYHRPLYRVSHIL